MPDAPTLRMSFDPHTIEHLGIKMYSQIPSAIAELVANAFDADATVAQIKLFDDGNEKRIEVIDNGIGMDFDDLNNKFLRIGRNRRADGAEKSPKGRVATGKKGIGKLALFGLGDLIEVKTTKTGADEAIKFLLSWNDLISTKQGDYLPRFEYEQNLLKTSGTTVVLRNLRRASAFDLEGLAAALSKLFNCFSKDFACSISLNDKNPIQIDNELKFKSIDIQFEWNFPEFGKAMPEIYDQKSKITGKIVSSYKPLRPGLRGITLFANGRQVNTPEFFGLPESSHVFSYIAGWLDVDFVDELREDVISTNRQSWRRMRRATIGPSTRCSKPLRHACSLS